MFDARGTTASLLPSWPSSGCTPTAAAIAASVSFAVAITKPLGMLRVLRRCWRSSRPIRAPLGRANRSAGRSHGGRSLKAETKRVVPSRCASAIGLVCWRAAGSHKELLFIQRGVYRNIEKPDHHLFPALLAESNFGLGIRIARIVRGVIEFG